MSVSQSTSSNFCLSDNYCLWRDLRPLDRRPLYVDECPKHWMDVCSLNLDVLVLELRFLSWTKPTKDHIPHCALKIFARYLDDLPSPDHRDNPRLHKWSHWWRCCKPGIAVASSAAATRLQMGRKIANGLSHISSHLKRLSHLKYLCYNCRYGGRCKNRAWISKVENVSL